MSKAIPKTNATKRRQTHLAGATISEFDGVRYLHLGTDWVQGAMRIRKPRQLELEYIQRMMVWLLWLPTEALVEFKPPGQGGCRAVQLGLGAGAITRFTHQALRWHTTVVEINPSVVTACRIWFHLPDDDERLQVVEADAGRWVQQDAVLQSADALCIDLYDHDAAAPVLDDDAFYAACHGVLAPGGLMTVNLFGRDASFARSAARIAAVFGADQVWQLVPTKEGNTVLVAARGVAVPDRETLTARAEAIEARFGLPARKWLRMVRPWQPTSGETD
jgi:spermidine synthase